MHTIPSRPERAELKEQVLKNCIAENEAESESSRHARKFDWVAETILKYDADDGFDLMLELHNNEGWELSREVLEDLDNYVNSVTRAKITATKEWIKEHNILSLALPVGTQIKIKSQNITGTITRITDSDFWDLASYEVTSPSLKGSRNIVYFEDAEALPQ